LYLSPIIDLFNQEIISYELTERPVFNQVVMKAFKKYQITQSNTALRSRLAISNETISVFTKEKELYKVCQERKLFRQCYN
jgi:IS1 family transposase